MRNLFSKSFNIFLCFLIYSFFGWVIETIYMSIYHGHIVKRGFLISPFCAIYGISVITVIYVLRYLKARPFLIFLCSSLMITSIELITGILLAMLFNKRLWDYSERFADFMGFICLSNSIIWGILAVIVVYIIHPAVSKLIASTSIKTKELLCYSLFIWLSFDLVISVYTSLQGINNIDWASRIIFQRIENIEGFASKVVYFISR